MWQKPKIRIAETQNLRGRNQKNCVAETQNLRGRNQQFAWQKPKICVAETQNLRGRNPKFAWQKPKICVAETQNLRGRNQQFAWQKPKICVAETQNFRGRGRGRGRGRERCHAWQREVPRLAERAATPCHVRRGSWQLSVPHLCHATPAHVAERGSSLCHAWHLSLPRVAHLSATRGSSLCHAWHLSHASSSLCHAWQLSLPRPLPRKFWVSATQILSFCHANFGFLPRKFGVSATQFFGFCYAKFWLLPFKFLVSARQILGFCQANLVILPPNFLASATHKSLLSAMLCFLFFNSLTVFYIWCSAQPHVWHCKFFCQKVCILPFLTEHFQLPTVICFHSLRFLSIVNILDTCYLLLLGYTVSICFQVHLSPGHVTAHRRCSGAGWSFGYLLSSRTWANS